MPSKGEHRGPRGHPDFRLSPREHAVLCSQPPVWHGSFRQGWETSPFVSGLPETL